MGENDYKLIYQSIYKVLNLYDKEFAKEFNRDDNEDKNIIMEAMNLASGGEELFNQNPPKDKPLYFILDEFKEKKEELRYFDIKEMEKDSIFAKEDFRGSYRDIFGKAKKELEKFKESDKKKFNYLDILDSLFQKYLTFIPAPIKGDKVTISLYDFLKSTIAFAIVLKDSKKILLINGNFGGIQKFIFTDVKTSKASKTLRAKSATISLLTNLVALKFVDSLELSPFNIVQNASGEFLIVARESDKKKIDKLKESIKEEFFKISHGEFNLNIVYEIFNKNDFLSVDLSKTMNILKEKKEDEKLKSFDDKFGVVKDNRLTEPCEICKKREVKVYDENGNRCEFCDDIIEFGEKLTLNDKNSYFVIYKNRNEQNLFTFFDIGYSFNIKNDKPSPNHKVLTYWDISLNSNFDGVAKRDISAYVPTYKDNTKDRKKGKVKSFDDISNRKEKNSIGSLITLKADIDNLGKVFKKELPKSDNISFAKYNTLSRIVDKFFTYYLPFELQEKFENIYTVFAGGDDLFLIGKWDDILNFTSFIQEKFQEFADSKATKITLSSGLFMSKSNKPVRYLSTLAKQALNDSKDFENKNAVSIFDLTMQSDIFIKIMDIAKELKKYDEDYKLATTFWYKLIEFCDKAEACENDKSNLENYLWKSQFRYLTQRNLIEKFPKDKQSELMEFIEKLFCLIEFYKKDLKLALFYLIYQRRENGNIR